MEQDLLKKIEYELKQIGNSDIKVENIRFHKLGGKQYALADVSYTWWLNVWEKQVEHKDMIFVLIDNEWKSPLFWD